MATPEPLTQLPKDITGLARMLPSISSQVTSASVDRWAHEPGLAEINYLRSVKLDWQLSFSKSGTSKILFIFRRKKMPWVMLAAGVSLTFRVANPLESRPRPAIEDVRRLVRFPSFFLANPTQEQLTRFAPPGATKENTVMFRLGSGKNTLAITNPELGKKATLRYSRGEVPGPVEPQDGKYSLAQFVDLASTIRDWLANDKPSSAATELTGPPSEDTAVHQILTALLQAYVDSSDGLASAIVKDPFIAYVIEGYELSLNLRVREDGSLAEKKEEEAFRVIVDAAVTPGPPPTISVDLEPPDFLISGNLFDAFFSALTPEGPVRALAKAAQVNPGFMRLFIAGAKQTATIFRIERDGKRDVDLMILSGELTGSPTTLVIKASFMVKTEKDPPSVELDEDSVEILKIVGNASDPTAQIPFRFVDYYLLLASSLRHWLIALGRW